MKLSARRSWIALAQVDCATNSIGCWPIAALGRVQLRVVAKFLHQTKLEPIYKYFHLRRRLAHLCHQHHHHSLFDLAAKLGFDFLIFSKFSSLAGNKLNQQQVVLLQQPACLLAIFNKYTFLFSLMAPTKPTMTTHTQTHTQTLCSKCGQSHRLCSQVDQPASQLAWFR